MKFGIQFILRSSNLKYNDAIESVINLVPKIGKRFNIVANMNLPTLNMFGEDGFAYVKSESKSYAKFEKAYYKEVKEKFIDKS